LGGKRGRYVEKGEGIRRGDDWWEFVPSAEARDLASAV